MSAGGPLEAGLRGGYSAAPYADLRLCPPFLLLNGGGYGSGARVRRRAVLEAVLTGVSFFWGRGSGWRWTVNGSAFRFFSHRQIARHVSVKSILIPHPSVLLLAEIVVKPIR